MNPDLEGKVALVTGGAWDVAEIALARAAGCRRGGERQDVGR
jgi:hypothetical protein